MANCPARSVPSPFAGGTLANTHFVAIPYNAAAKAGALVLADFLLSPEAQAHKQDPKVWGDPTVLAMDKLSAADKARFDALDLGIATLKPEELGPALDEPHPSWMTRMETNGSGATAPQIEAKARRQAA